MTDELIPFIVPIRSPWRDTLLEALKQVQHSLFMICPYIKDEVVIAMKNVLLARASTGALGVRVITRALPEEFLSGSSDVTALQQLLAWPADITGSSVEIRAIDNIHAKVWIFDERLAMIGSGNATPSGLDNNLEYGIAVSDAQLVQQIGQDWQTWWEQASSVNDKALMEMSLWLKEVSDSDEVRLTREQQKAITKKLSAAPRIGKRISLHTRGAQGAARKLIAKEHTSPYPEVIVPDTQEILLRSTQSIPTVPREPISIAVDQLWQALIWTCPFSEEERAEEILQRNVQRDAFLKLVWLPTAGKPVMQCIWADGKRYSQATLESWHSDQQKPWAITLDKDQVKLLVDTLQKIQTEQPSAGDPISLFVALETSPYRLLITSSQERIDGKYTSIPCTQASLPGSFPTLHPPLSTITVQHTLLQEALTTLEQQWSTINKDNRKLTVVEIYLATPGASSTISLSTGPIDAPCSVSIAANDCKLIDHEVKLCLDYPALQHVLASISGKVANWQLRTGSDAETLQWIPQSDMLKDNPLLWRHELRHLAG